MSELSNNWVPALIATQFVLFPGTGMPLTVTDSRNLAAIREMKRRGNKLLQIVTLRDPELPRSLENLYTASCLAEVEYIKGKDSKEVQLIVRGVERQRLLDLVWHEGSALVRAESLTIDYDIDGATVQAFLDKVKEQSDQIVAFLPQSMQHIGDLLRAVDDPELLVNLIAPHLEVPLADKALLLGEASVQKRLLKLSETLESLRHQLEIRAEIGRKVSSQYQKQHRDAVLRQQLKVIQEELGEEKTSKNSYKKRLSEHPDIPEAVKEIALEEAERLSQLERSSPEAPGLQSYLDLVLDLPWKAAPRSNIDLGKAREILDAHHYGLEKVKERIVQHLAVLKLKENFRGSILLLVGPPGVGKTSLGRSIAEAMGREFVRASLGGVRDEAEIRGHRRTYIGSRPGRIIQALKQCKQNNPVFMLDEIDKLSQSYSGDPAAALLEVLDPEQNNSFRDHFLEVPYDLSQVMFIATANSLESIPGPLRDRMEIIALSGYTTAEKLHIAKQHLWPEQLEVHGVKPEQLTLSEDALLRLITHYTREAGVRDLKRKLAALIRGTTEAIIKSEQPILLKLSDVERLLGQEPFTLELAETHMPAGVVTGLAWTPMGGDILFIEAKAMPGKGQLTITGQMGEVMKESVQIAMTHVRALLPHLRTRLDYEKTDVHVHVPAGAIPKDGPSAGVTMLTALASLFSQRPVAPTLAMTGEITLRGAVTAVGGIKEKVMAAHRAGIKKILMAERNRKDLQDVPQEVKDELTFVFVRRVEEVLKEALGIEPQEDQSTLPETGSGSIAQL